MNNWRIRFLNFILRRLFYLLYNPFAWTYDFVAAFVSVGKWKDWVLSIQAYLPGPIILELGYGPGHLQRALLENHAKQPLAYSPASQIMGLDASAQMSRQARRRLGKLQLPYKLVQARSQAIPFPAGFFDQVTATFPSEYIYHPDTIQEIARVLKPTGSAVIMPQAQITGRKGLKRLAAWLFRVTGQAFEVDKIWRRMIQQPFLQAGFHTKIEEIILPGSKIQVIIARKTKI